MPPDRSKEEEIEGSSLALETFEAKPASSFEIMADDAPLLDDDEHDENIDAFNRNQHHALETPQERHKPSNEKLLGTAFVSFFSFACTQSVFAYIAGSQAMMGDSAAMLVDALTYGFNWLAERHKAKYTPDPSLPLRVQQRNIRKTTLQWELIPPLISVSTLIIVTIVVLKESVKILILDSRRSRSEQDTPDVRLMLAFSVLNLVLDVVNVGCFASADHALGYATTDDRVVNQTDNSIQDANNSSSVHFSTRSNGTGYNPVSIVDGDQNGTRQGLELLVTESKDEATGSIQESDIVDFDNDETEANLNMCSAYTHVFADTLRSFAVIVAASVALACPAVTPEIADATAALIVSVLIGLSLVPLFQGLVRTWSEYRAIRYEEESVQLIDQEMR